MFLLWKNGACHHKMQKEKNYKSQANTTSSNETNNIQLCLNIGSNCNETWYLDSNATQHVILHGGWFYDYKIFNSPLPIYLGNFST